MAGESVPPAVVSVYVYCPHLLIAAPTCVADLPYAVRLMLRLLLLHHPTSTPPLFIWTWHFTTLINTVHGWLPPHYHFAIYPCNPPYAFGLV